MTENDKMRTASGEVRSSDPLVAFVYLLARDHFPVGVVEEMLYSAINVETVYTNGWLAQWAAYTANRLREGFDSRLSYAEALQAAHCEGANKSPPAANN